MILYTRLQQGESYIECLLFMGSRGVETDANVSNGASDAWTKSKGEVFQGEDGMGDPHGGRAQSDSSAGHMETLVASEEGAEVTLCLPQMRLCPGSWSGGRGAAASLSRLCFPCSSRSSRRYAGILLDEDIFHGKELADSRPLQALVAGLKAYSTWENVRCLQDCRECTGGMVSPAGPRAPQASPLQHARGHRCVLTSRPPPLGRNLLPL